MRFKKITGSNKIRWKSINSRSKKKWVLYFLTSGARLLTGPGKSTRLFKSSKSLLWRRKSLNRTLIKLRFAPMLFNKASSLLIIQNLSNKTKMTSETKTPPNLLQEAPLTQDLPFQTRPLLTHLQTFLKSRLTPPNRVKVNLLHHLKCLNRTNKDLRKRPRPVQSLLSPIKKVFKFSCKT